MLSRLSRRLFARRGPRLGLVAVVVIAAIGAALFFALKGPDARAGAIAGALSAAASAMAALTALHLSREALSRTDQQLAHARLVMTLSRRPLLLPVHQSVSYPDSSGRLAAHPPTADRFMLRPPDVGSYAFVADTNDTLLLPIENSGEGPAIRVVGGLWHRSGRKGSLVGPTVIGAGKSAIFTVRLGAPIDDLPTAFLEAVGGVGRGEGHDFYWLELTYDDVFGNSLSGWAFFDPRGLGAWHVVASANQVTKLV